MGNSASARLVRACMAYLSLHRGVRAFTMLQTPGKHQVVFVRHGESTFNQQDRYIGWSDVPLTPKGESEATKAGQALKAAGFEFDIAYSSMLKRAIKTGWLALTEIDQVYIPELKHWRLNERFYGDMVGKTPPEAIAAFGADNVELWRTSYDIPPTPMSRDSSRHPGKEIRYNDVPVPQTECMADVEVRVSYLWDNELCPVVTSGKRLVVFAHANCLKALLKHIDGLAPEDVIEVAFPRATPILYTFDKDMQPVRSDESAKPWSGVFVIPTLIEDSGVNAL